MPQKVTKLVTKSGKILGKVGHARSERDAHYHLLRIVVGQRVPAWLVRQTVKVDYFRIAGQNKARWAADAGASAMNDRADSVPNGFSKAAQQCGERMIS